MKTKVRIRFRTAHRWALGAIAAVGMVAWAAPAHFAQDAPSKSDQVVRVTSGLVNIYAVVRDKNRPVTGLNREDFEIEEDDKPQEIRFFSRETDTPLTLGILIDTSASQVHVLGVEQREATTFIDQVIGKKDLAFVLRFDTEVELLQDLTANKRLLANAIDSTVINRGAGGVVPGPFPTSGGGGTNLHDAVYLSARELLKNEVGRKVIIILSDGEDTGSAKKLSEALEVAQRSDVIIYSIAVIDREFYFARRVGFSGDSTLKRYAEQTGGRVSQVTRSEDTAEAFREIAEELRTQYSLGYTSSNTRRDGTFRKIKIKIRNQNYKVFARRGYYGATE
ncbi:MAG: VWA domain-containing protein [Acidobacteria bacterium]|nr:VWA domain-containing protein [Acidobacteriota bacterium]